MEDDDDGGAEFATKLAPRFLYDEASRFGAWFVAKKYQTLKEELLHNKLLRLACNSWNDCHAKALLLHETILAKRVVCKHMYGDDSSWIDGT